MVDATGQSRRFRIALAGVLASAFFLFGLAELAPRGGAEGTETVERLRTCGGEPFSMSVVSRPAGYEREKTALAALLRREIKRDRGLMPRRDWRVVFGTANRAELVSGKPS